MATWIYIVISIVFLVLPVIAAIYKLVKISTCNTITFIKGEKRLTVLSGHLSAKDRTELVNF
jgi:hypothetical protein